MMQTWVTQWYWREPLWLLLGLFPLALIVWRRVLQQSTLGQYAERSLHRWVTVQSAKTQYLDYWRDGLLLLTWCLLGMAAAGPRLMIAAPDDIQPPQGKAVIILDNSRSMQAADVYPNRHTRALIQAQRWIQAEAGIEIGLVVFAGAPHILVPPTADKRNLAELGNLLDQIQLPTHGSAIDQAITQAANLLQNNTGDKAIIVLTDGDFEVSRQEQLSAVARQLSGQDITLYLLGVGTPSPITLHDRAGRWLLHKGQAVTTRLNEPGLKNLAAQEHVFYQRLNPGLHKTLADIWQPQITRIAAANIDRVLWRELFPWFLLPAIVLLLLINFELRRANALIIAGLSLGLVLMSLNPGTARAESHAKLFVAHKAWRQQDYEQAASLYAEIDGYEARMGEGASCFRQEDIDCAIAAFNQAAWQAETDTQRGEATYNLGNSYFRRGDFPAAITSYRDALRYQPNMPEYLNNLSFTEEVQQQIELRLRQEAASLARRMAPGMITRAIDDNMPLSPDMPVILDDKQPPAGDSVITTEVLQQYLERYRNLASLRDEHGKVYKRQHDWKRYSNENPVAANQLAFWQRLFELEENIHATQDEPRTLDGVLPW